MRTKSPTKRKKKISSPKRDPQAHAKRKAPARTNLSVRPKTNNSGLRQNHDGITELQQELKYSRDYQDSLIEESETVQGELTLANEELQSINEELQSINEELETAKEELQSSNEELMTSNDELQKRSIEQTQLSDDLINLIGSVEIPIVMLGNDRKIRRFTPNAAKALNLIPSDIGRPLSDLKWNFSIPGVELDLDAMVREVTETICSKEAEVQDRLGHWHRLQIRPYKTTDKKIEGAVLALVDIDALKQSIKEVKMARNEAERANRAKDLFLATLSHELRTPLTTILSWAQMLQSGKLNAKQEKRAVEMIEESGKAQAQLINDLLDVSRIIMGKLSLKLSPVDPLIIAQDAIESIRPTADIKMIQIETVFDLQVGKVMADPVRIRQIFWNLLSNAIKFSTPQSKVSVKIGMYSDCPSQKTCALIQIVDSGKGISPEFLPHIFDRFSQEDHSSSIRSHGGLGLGLAIVRNLVELHGGSVFAESSGETKGATFSVFLPVQAQLQPSEISSERVRAFAEKSSVGARKVNLRGLRVLIVDDDANAREAFCEILKSLGVVLKSAESVREALELFPMFKPQVLVSDIAMPGEDGYALIKKIKALPSKQGREVACIALTAYAGTEDIQRALLSGFQAHLSKPVDAKHLAAVIARVAGR